MEIAKKSTKRAWADHALAIARDGTTAPPESMDTTGTQAEITDTMDILQDMTIDIADPISGFVKMLSRRDEKYLSEGNWKEEGRKKKGERREKDCTIFIYMYIFFPWNSFKHFNTFNDIYIYLFYFF